MRAALRAKLLVLALILLTPAALAGDVIRLKNGGRLAGRIVAEDADEVTIELPGAGRMTVARTEIAEILRDVPDGRPEGSLPAGEVLRSEHSFVWSGRRRVGYRSLWVRRLSQGGYQCEEESVFTDEEGKKEVVIRIVERVTSAFDPVDLDYRELSARGQLARRVVVKEGRLTIETSLPGERRKTSLAVPAGFRFPLSAREFAIRERERLKGAYEVQVFDPREENFFQVRYEPAGTRRMDWEGEVILATVLRRRRGERAVEEIWLDPAGRALTEELNGPEIVAVLTTRERIEAVREGGSVAATEEEERIRPLFVHPEAGFSVRKPTISWSFERQERGGKKALSITNLRTFAYVDVFVETRQPEGGLLASLAVEMERRFAGASKDFEKLSDGYLEVGGEKAYRMVASSRNKGEELRSLLVGVLHGGRTYLIAMACPRAYWEEAEPEFEKILRSFSFLGGGGEE